MVKITTPINKSYVTEMLKGRFVISVILLFISLSFYTCFSSDTLNPSESLAGNQTLVSSNNKYELGFFSPGNNNNSLYLGIWYFNLTVKTIVWVANRNSPAPTSSVITLNLKTSGELFITDQGSSGTAIWSSSNQSTAVNPILQLLDSGNLVIRESKNLNDYIWQSFDYPTDTLLPGQKLGWDKNSGLDRYITSWKSSNDPSAGDYMFRVDRSGDPEVFLLKAGVQKIYRSGPFVGQRFSGVPPMSTKPTLDFSFHYNPNVEVYYEVDVVDPTLKTRLVLDETGTLSRYTWLADSQKWDVYWLGPKDECDHYMTCGTYGVCDVSQLFVCECSEGFEPRNLTAWGLKDAAAGCRRKTSLDCRTDEFTVLSGMKLPESGAAMVDTEMGLEECRETCKKDCECSAYSNWHMIDGIGSGCLMWIGDLMDMRTYSQSGQDLYVRLAAGTNSSGKTKKKDVIGVSISVVVVVVVLLIAIGTCFAWKKKHPSTSNAIGDLELPLYDFEAVVVATNNFCNENKLGEGGFGYVYKGVWKEGEEIAIKRLSRESRQGEEEFMNEVKLIAKLQHNNLVRLLGCCLRKEEKILIYEYLPNRSLDTMLFHKERCYLLNWQRRFNIICGIARGLQYLHHDSRVKIIHRDLKSNNILLDHDMNPKISDFGMARIFRGDEAAANNTHTVVGTYGYMAPEYAIHGVFSIKSDVFSFGVLMLEIITGKKNTRFYDAHNELSLLGYTWKMWKGGNGAKLLDPSLGGSYSAMEAERCIQIGLICVQERPDERPTMLSVVMWLSSETAALPEPKPPGFCVGRGLSVETNSSTSQHEKSSSVNEVTVTIIDGR